MKNRNKYVSKIKWILIVCILITLIIIIQQYIFKPKQEAQQNSNISRTKNSPINLPPVDKKAGWSPEVENQILAMCPSAIQFIKPHFCTCVLSKIEQTYTSTQAQQILQTYQNTHKIDPQIQTVITSCN